MCIKTTLLMMTLASPAFAFGVDYGQTFLFCQIENSSKFISVRFDDIGASYRFGASFEEPELQLAEEIATLDYTPWPGAGSAIWEDVVFSNEGYTYTVSVGFNRIFPEDQDGEIETQAFGGVIVKRAGAIIAELSCDPETVLSDGEGQLAWAKNQLGYVWDGRAGEWVALPD